MSGVYQLDEGVYAVRAYRVGGKRELFYRSGQLYDPEEKAYCIELVRSPDEDDFFLFRDCRDMSLYDCDLFSVALEKLQGFRG